MEPFDLVSRLLEISRRFRQGMEGYGCGLLAQMIDPLAAELPKLAVADFEKMQLLLQQALAAQERKDFLLVADYLEYEILPLLQSLSPNGQNC